MSTSTPFSPGDRVIAYLRDSGHEDQEMSTRQQEESLRAWCVKNDLVLSRIYSDVAKPGSSADKRPAFQEMIAHFHEKTCPDRGVIIWASNRFARNIDDAQFYRADLRRRGYVVYSITDNIPDTPEGRIIEAAIGFTDQKYLEKMSLDIQRGLYAIVQQYGAVPGNPPPGFKRASRVIGTHRDGTQRAISYWVFDDDKLPIVRSIWKMRSEGMTIKLIHQKYPDFYKNRSSYVTFFKNKIYRGELHYGDITVENYCDPIIDEATWNKVQELNNLNERSAPKNGVSSQNNPRRIGSNFLLSGILYCQRCGSLMNGKIVHFGGKKRNDYYICSGSHANMACDAPAIPRAVIEENVIQDIAEYIKNPEILSAREANRATLQKEESEEIEARIRLLQKQISENERKISNLTDRLADDANAPKSIITKLRTLETNLESQRTEIILLNSRRAKIDVRARTPAQSADLSKNLIRLLSSSDVKEQKSIIKLFVDRVVAERDGSNVHGSIIYYDPGVEESPPKLMPTG